MQFLPLFAVLIFFCSSQASQSNYSLYRFSLQRCKDNESGREMYVGEVFMRPGKCISVQCLGTLEIWEDSCQVPPGLKGECVTVPASDASADYPRCCPMYDCKTHEGINGEIEKTNTYDHNGNLRRSRLTELIIINEQPRRINDMPAVATAPKRAYHIAQ